MYGRTTNKRRAGTELPATDSAAICSGALRGLGIGAVYGLVRPALGDVSRLRAGVVLGLAATAGSDVPATGLGVTDPREWGLNAWVSGLVPHLAYGLTTAIAHDAITGARARRRR